MIRKKKIDWLSIKGFKSIQNLEKLRLDGLNVLIGANGVGKSNFVSFFRMLAEMMEQRLQVWTKKQGGADRILTYGIKETSQLKAYINFDLNGYEITLEPTPDGGFTFSKESLFFKGPYFGPDWTSLGSGHLESKLKDKFIKSNPGTVEDFCYSSISNWKVFHFHDTSDTAGVKRLSSLHDNEYLRSDASNLAAYLYFLKENHLDDYEKIRKVVQLAVPFFDDFVLKDDVLPSEEKQIRLLWKQIGSDYSLWPNQLSDGSIRFICLATALLQPNPPSTIIIDEPELGLHPYAITLLGSLLKSNSSRMQVIVSTQSVPLLNEFSLDDLIVVERENESSVFRKLRGYEFERWLEDYCVGELWEKNVLGGRPNR